MTENEKLEKEMLERQLKRLQDNFTDMVKNDEEVNKMLDWINKIRNRIEMLEKK